MTLIEKELDKVRNIEDTKNAGLTYAGTRALAWLGPAASSLLVGVLGAPRGS